MRTGTEQNVIHRQLGPIPYAANAKVPFKIERGSVIRQLILNLTCAPTVIAGSNTAANTGRGDEWALIKDISVIANGNDVIFRATGDELWWHARAEIGRNPEVTSTLADGTTANPSIDSTLVIYFESPWLKKAWDTVLDTRNFADVRIEVTFGDHTTINSAASGFTTSPTLNLSVLESYNTPLGLPFFTKRVGQIIDQPTGANTRRKIELPVGPIRYRYLLINTQDNAGTPVDSGSIVNSFRIESNATLFYDLKANDVRRTAEARRMLQVTAAKRSSKSSATGAGWYMLDLVTDGLISEGLNAETLGQLWLVCDVAAAGTIRVMPQSLTEPPTAA